MKLRLTDLLTKRAVLLALAVLMVLGVGSARADFDPAYTGAVPVAEESPAPEGSPVPEDSASPEGGIVPPGGGGGNVNNEVVVINRVDGRSAHRAALGVARVTGGEAHNQNAAAATSSCDDCRTVAVATQIVIIQRTNATEIAPRNYAIALNAGCTRCETFAASYQYVFTTDGLVRFDDGVQQKLAGLQGQIRSVAGNDDLTFPEMEAKIDGLVEQMWALARSELQAVGLQGTGRPSKDTDAKKTGNESPSPSPSAEPSESPSPKPSASDGATGATDDPEASPSPSASPEADPAASPSAEPTG